jgi:ABC-type bacteriocin/lantibiotic exporter with double-glycine peptidase domain
VSPALTAVPLVALIVVIVIACICERYIRRHPRNRYTRKARRWPTDGNTHTSYWSGARRFSQE